MLSVSSTIGQPDNDAFANRISLAGTNLLAEAHNFDATLEPGEPNHSDPPWVSFASAWWTWTAQVTGLMNVRLFDTYPQKVVAVYTGSSVSALTLVRKAAYDTGYFPVFAGTTYQIAIASDYRTGFGPGAFKFRLETAQPPVNDLFANRTTVSGAALDLVGNTIGTTREMDEPVHGTRIGVGSVWYSWTAPFDGTAALTTTSAESLPFGAIYHGGSLASLVQATTMPFWGAGVFRAINGVTYQVAIEAPDEGGRVPFVCALALSPMAITFPADGTVLLNHAPLTVQLTNLPTATDAPFTELAIVDQTGLPIATAPVGSSSVLLPSLPPGTNRIFARLSDAKSRRFLSPTVTFRLISLEDTFPGVNLGKATNATVLADFRNNSREPGEPASYLNHGTLWWTWQAPFTGRLFLQGGGLAGILMELFTGDQVNALTANAAAPGDTTGGAMPAFDVVANQMYRIRAVQTAGDAGTTGFGINLMMRPANDNFANRVALPPVSTNLHFEIGAASTEPGDPLMTTGVPGMSVWYSFTPPRSGRLRLTSANAQSGIFTGASLATLTAVAGSGIDSSMVVTAGTQYQIWVAGNRGPGPETQVLLTYTPRPANDDFAQRQALVGSGGSVAGSDLESTLEPGEPFPAGSHSVWYSWTAPATGVLQLSADFGTPPAWPAVPGFRVFTGSSLSNLVEVPGWNTESSGARFFNIQSGVNYGIAFFGNEYSFFNFTLNYGFAPVPPNDAFTSRLALTGSRIEFRGTNIAATMQSADPKPLGGRMTNTIWWAWTAPVSGWARFSATDTNPPPFLAVFEGSSLSKLKLATDWAPFPARSGYAPFWAVAGHTYALGASRFVDANGDISFSTDVTGFGLLLDLTTLRFLTPASNDIVTLPVQPVLELTAAQPAVDGTITNVTFMLADTNTLQTVSLGSDSAAPFRLEPTNFPAGRHVVTALAINSTGLVRFVPPVSFTVRPTNDPFESRTIVAGRHLSWSGTAAGANRQASEPNHGGRTNGASVWYSWTAPATGNVTLWFTNVETVAIYTGSALGGLTPVSATYSFYGASWRATRGVTYQIAADDPRGLNYGFTQRFDLAIELHSVSFSAPANGAVFTFPSSISLQPTIGEQTNDVARIEYFADGGIIGQSAAAPFATLWTSAVPGYHTLSSRLWLKSGESVDSEPIQIVVRPANDTFANRVSVTSNLTVLHGTTAGALPEPGVVTGGNETWFSWQAPTNGLLRLNPTNGAVKCAVFAGSNVVTLIAQPDLLFGYGMHPPRPGSAFRVSAAQHYQIAVFPPLGGTEGEFDAEFRFTPLPVNDHFTNAVTVFGEHAELPGQPALATVEPGELQHADWLPAHSIWWRWTAPRTGIVTFTNSFAPPLPRIAIYTGSTLESLVRVRSLSVMDDSHTYQVWAGTTYQLGLDDISGLQDALAMRLDMTDAPPNDNFANRTPLVGRVATAPGSTIGSTRETGEPDHDQGTNSASVWYTWTAPASGKLTAGPLGTVFYRGNSLTNLLRVVPPWPDSRLDIIGGETYQIAVDSGVLFSESFIFGLELVYPPPHDQFAAREVITGTSASVQGWNMMSTREFGEPNHAGIPGGRSVWHTWRAPSSGQTRLHVLTSDFPPLLSVYTGSRVDELTPVTSASDVIGDGIPEAESLFPVTSGVDYRIAVDGPGGQEGNFTLSLDFNESLRLEAAPAAAGQLTIRVSGASATGVVIERTTNLVDWMPLLTLPSGGTNLIHLPMTNDPLLQFYRARLLEP